MSGNFGDLKKGIHVKHHDQIKIVEDWHFVSECISHPINYLCNLLVIYI